LRLKGNEAGGIADCGLSRPKLALSGVAFQE
jgi:hypothetical protein